MDHEALPPVIPISPLGGQNAPTAPRKRGLSADGDTTEQPTCSSNSGPDRDLEALCFEFRSPIQAWHGPPDWAAGTGRQDPGSPAIRGRGALTLNTPA